VHAPERGEDRGRALTGCRGVTLGPGCGERPGEVEVEARCARADLDAVAREDVACEPWKAVANLESGPHGAPRVVVVRERHAEAHELQNRASGSWSAPHDVHVRAIGPSLRSQGASTVPSARTSTPSSRRRWLTRNWNADQAPGLTSTRR
jgi:hypothetical protein